MKYLIIGTGGTGGSIGSYLAKSGKDVTFIARGAHLQAMKEQGLVVHSDRKGNFIIADVQASTMENYNGRPDVIFVCVKYYSLDETLDFLRRVTDFHTLVIPILNVFGTGNFLQQKLPETTVLDGCVYIAGKIEAPGIINQAGTLFRVYFGFRKGQDRRLVSMAADVAAALDYAGIDAFFSDDIKRDTLQKFSFVSAMGAAGLYYHSVSGDFLKQGEQQDTLLGLIREIELLGKAMGITFTIDLVAQGKEILANMPDNITTSMQRDVENGGFSEIDGLIYQVVQLADEYHVDAPTYRKISAWAKQSGIK